MNKKLNRIRTEIIAQLQEFLQLEAQIDEFEKHYLAYVLLPGYQLQSSMQMRKYLEEEYQRISVAIERGLFSDSSEIETEVREALRHGDTAFGYFGQGNSYFGSNGGSGPGLPETIEVDYEIDPVGREQLIKEFRKVVLPRIHADTSDAPFEIFNAAFEAYKKKDYLLLAAFVIQYREETGHKDAMNPERQTEYRKVFKALRRRVRLLREDPAMLKLEDREQVLVQMKKQNIEIRRAAIQEAERMLRLRHDLEQLIQMQYAKGEIN